MEGGRRRLRPVGLPQKDQGEMIVVRPGEIGPHAGPSQPGGSPVQSLPPEQRQLDA